MSTLCCECSDAAGAHWRRWAELALGDAPTVRASTDQDLRRAIKQLLDARAHTIEVMAEAVRAGDVDAVRMHHEHVAGAEPDLSVECTPATARWCPVCGTCKCRRDGLGGDLSSPACPLHAAESPHGEPFTEPHA